MADKVTTTKAVAKEVDPKDKVAEAMAALKAALIEAGRSENDVDALLYALRPVEVNVVGNFADLQRMGAAVAAGEDSSMKAAVESVPVTEG